MIFTLFFTHVRSVTFDLLSLFVNNPPQNVLLLNLTPTKREFSECWFMGP